MNRSLSQRLGLGLLALSVGAVGFLSQTQPVKAGFLDSIFNQTTSAGLGNLIEAGSKSKEGNPSLESNVFNVNDAFQYTSLLNLAGPTSDAVAGDTSLYEKYGHGAIADVMGSLHYFYQPPATTQTFVADLLNEAHLVPKAQAQGLGFAALDPVLGTWKMFRNLAYLLYVVLFLVIGFMVMFKAQMGKTAVTLQSALPNIVISLIFVTFSYAIAGFLIDAMYLIMYLLIGMFPSADGGKLLDYNFLELGRTIILGNGNQAGAFQSFADAVDAFVSQAVSFSKTDSNSSFGGMLAGITMSLIMAVAILIGVFKLFFELLKTYVTIILLIAFSPLILMLGAIPGQDVFQGWVRDIAGHLMAFPTTLLIIIVFRMFNSSVSESAGSATEIVTGGFMPPFMIGRGTAGSLTTLVGIGIVLIMPELIKEMKKALGVKEGIFTVLGKNMMENFGKNFKQGSLALEGGAIVGAGTAGAIAGGSAYLRGKEKRFNLRKLGSSMIHGFTPDGSKETYGGLTNWGSKTQKVAHKGRVFLDRLAEGRALDAEDMTTLIANQLAGKSADGKNNKTQYRFVRPVSGKKSK
ncbi:MAG TPA: hypothetical protein DEP87_00240 [Candidatus Pacebacteria bacterium]|nr:hypothetical protein [Candidatus Paceibacterota bacterium]